MSFLVSVLGLGALILVHEAGHFFVARAVGMNPRKFYIGFPPALVKRMHKGIEYGIGTIPLGGYVKIPGMHRPAASDIDDHFRPVLVELPGLRRPLAELEAAIDADDLPAARATLHEIEELAGAVDLSPEARKAADRGVTEIADACADDAYWRAATWKRVVVILAGPGANFIVALLLFWLAFSVSLGPATNRIAQVSETFAIGATVQRSAAAAAGIRDGDRVVKVNGEAIADGPALVDAIVSSAGSPLAFVVLRDGREVALPAVRPVLIDGKYRVGIGLDNSGYPVGEAGWRALKALGFVSRDTGKSLGNLVHQSGRDQISSPVGIVRESAKAASAGWESYVTILAFISLSLGLLNLLPLLPLDGGHIAVSLLERLRGRAFAREAYMRVSMIGIALVLMLFFIGLTNDVGGRGG